MEKKKIPVSGILAIAFGVIFIFVGLLGAFITFVEPTSSFEDYYFTLMFLGFGIGFMMSGLNHRADDQMAKYLAYIYMSVAILGGFMALSDTYLNYLKPGSFTRLILLLAIGGFIIFGFYKIIRMLREQ